MGSLPDLLGDDGRLQLAIAEVKANDDDDVLIVMLAAAAESGAVGVYLAIEMMTGRRVIFPGRLQSLGAPSDALVAALGVAWRVPGQAMTEDAPCWIHVAGRPGALQPFRPSELATADAELELQLHARGSNEHVVAPLRFSRDPATVTIEIRPQDRSYFVELLSGARQAVHHE